MEAHPGQPQELPGAAAPTPTTDELEQAVDLDSTADGRHQRASRPQEEGSPRSLPAVASLEYQRAKLAEESKAAASAAQEARAEALRALQAGEPNSVPAHATSALAEALEHEGGDDQDTFVTAPGESYQVLANCRLRAGVELDSEPAGLINAGEVVVALEATVNDSGVTRVRIQQGWLSTRSSDGTQLLGPLSDDDSEYDESEDAEEDDGDIRATLATGGTAAPIRRLLRRIAPQGRNRNRSRSTRSSSSSASSTSSGEDSSDDDDGIAAATVDPEEQARLDRRSLHAWLMGLKPTARWKSGVDRIFARFEDEEVDWGDLVNPDFSLDHDALLRMGVSKEGHRGTVLLARKRLLAERAAAEPLEPQITSFYKFRAGGANSSNVG